MNQHNEQPKGTRRFVETCRLMRKQQQVLLTRGDAVSLSVADKIESIMQGIKGIKFTPKEKGRQEMAYEMAKFELAKEDAETKWEQYKGSAMVSDIYQRELSKEANHV